MGVNDMPETGRGLGEFVKRVMALKGLTQKDVQRMSGDRITDGYVASITIFDATGRPVRYLQRNALCGTKGSFRWDGLGEKNQQLATGIYILFTEVFNLNGKKKQFKKTIVLARRN